MATYYHLSSETLPGVEVKLRPIRHSDECASAADAARVFAARLAKHRYGRRGYAHHVRSDAWREDGRWHSYEAFIGRDAEGGGCSGRNVWLYVSTVDKK